MKSRSAVRRMVYHGLAWLFAAAWGLPLRAHHMDFLTVTADFRTDRPAWTVTVSVEALRVLEETQSTALAGDLQSSGGPPDAVRADVFRAAARYLSGRLHFFTDAPQEAVKSDYQFSLVSVPDAASGRTGLFVVGRHEGDLPHAARKIEAELTGGLRAMLIRKVDGRITGPALTLQPSAAKRTALDIPALSPVAAPQPYESGIPAVIVAAAVVVVAGVAILICRAMRH